MSLLTTNSGKQYVPKYVELARDLVRRIASRELEVGDRIGTEQEMSEAFGLSRVTVRRALELVEGEGYILRKRALGTFVAREVEATEQIGIRSERILLVCSNEQRSQSDEDSAFCTVLRAIEQRLAQQGFAVQILTIGTNPNEDRQRLKSLVLHGELKGIISIGASLEPYADLLTETRVVTSCSFCPTTFPWVGDDVAFASQVSVRHLLENGHRRIAMICGSWVDGEAFAAFARGFTAAMSEFKASIDRTLMVHSFQGESLETLAENILTLSPPPTAVFCENWRVCRAVLKAAAKLGMDIPNDLSIVGYGQNVSEISDPPVTAYVPETAKVGELAATLIGELVAGKAKPNEPVRVPGRLVERDSVSKLQAT